MPWCPNCKTEYREGTDACADCGAPLQPDPPRDKPVPDAGEEQLALLVERIDEMEAVSLSSFLEAEGIPSYHRGNSVTKRVGYIIGGTTVGPLDLYVPADRLEEAQRLLADLHVPPDTVEDDALAQYDEAADTDELERMDRRRRRVLMIVAWAVAIIFLLLVRIRL